MRRGAWSSMAALAVTCLFACGGTKREVRGGEAGRPPDPGGSAGGPISGGNGGKGGGGSAGVTMTSGPGGAGGGGSGLPPEVVGPAFFVTGCPLHPVPPATRAPGEVHLGADGLIRADERDCAYTASDPVTLPLVPGDGGDLLFHFDVNGDAIDDLFFGHLFSTEIPSPSLVVLESTLSGGALSFTRVACEDTGSVVPHGAFFLRDLNRDGVPDFIAQSGRTVDAWLNLPGSPRSVLHYTFPTNTSGWGAVLDVVVGDFDGDETDDVAMGFDYNGAATSSVLGIEMGTMLFRGRPGLGTYEAPTIIAQSPIGPDYSASVMQSGYIAGVPLASGGAGLIGLTWYATESPGWLFGAHTDEWLHAAHLPGREPAFVQYVAMGATGALVIGGTNEVAVYRLATDQLSLLKAQTTAFRHSIDRELGGGPRFRSMYLLDVEGDGVDDLIEYQRNPDPGRPPQLAIHTRIAETAGAAPVVVDLADFYSDLVESPFVAVGAMKGRLIVGDGDGDNLGSTGSPRPTTIRALNCAP
jgi:VCBS repeat protein